MKKKYEELSISMLGIYEKLINYSANEELEEIKENLESRFSYDIRKDTIQKLVDIKVSLKFSHHICVLDCEFSLQPW